MTMATTSLSMTSREVNGSAMAALLGGGIGAFAMGAVVLLNEAGIFAAPTLYAPAGGDDRLADGVGRAAQSLESTRDRAGPRWCSDPDPDRAGCAGDLSARLGN